MSEDRGGMILPRDPHSRWRNPIADDAWMEAVCKNVAQEFDEPRAAFFDHQHQVGVIARMPNGKIKAVWVPIVVGSDSAKIAGNVRAILRSVTA